MRKLPDFPELEPMALATGWWRYSEARTADRELQYREGARSLRGVLFTLLGIVQRLTGRRNWKPRRVDGRKYVVEAEAC